MSQTPLSAGRVRLVLAAIVLIAAAIFYEQGSDETPDEPGRLPALGADLSGTTVSGISSGAYMAGQFQMAHAELVTGAAIVAGGPYACSESAYGKMIPGPGAMFLNAQKAVSGCMRNALQLWGIPDPKRLANRTRELSEKGSIGAIEAITTDRVYLFSGRRDDTVKPEIVAAAKAYYLELGVPEDRIAFVDSFEAGHAFVTVDKGLSCSASHSPFVEDCDYDMAGALLEHLAGPLKPPAPAGQPAGRFVGFEQSRYSEGIDRHGMAEEGVVFVPEACENAPGCRVHVAFHGCQQSRALVGDAFVKDTGYARWAGANRMIVLFPQVKKGTFNPLGCWDWLGYTGSDYLTREGPQIRVVRAMLEALSQTRPGFPG